MIIIRIKRVGGSADEKKATAPLLAALVIVLVFSGCSSKTKIRLATGGATGTYYAYGKAVAQVLEDKMDGLTFDVQSTGASKANIYLIAGGEADMALVQSDVMACAYGGTGLFEGEKMSGFSAMAGLYAEVCQIVAKPRHQRHLPALGASASPSATPGSGVELNAMQIREAYGIALDDIALQNLSFADSAMAYKEGKIDAFFCTAGAPTTAIAELAAEKRIGLLPIDDAHAAALVAQYPFYTRRSIPAGTYSGVDQDVGALAVTAAFIVSDTLGEDTV
jgi:TRAP transporter TAXI family solute receptor